MNQRNTDDLFEGSTMTFGEHLEEFRGALARALVGLLIGVVIAIPFSPHAVEFVKGPLERALKRVEIKKAQRQMLAKGGDDLTIESWTTVAQNGMVPDQVRIDIDEIAAHLTQAGIKVRRPDEGDVITAADLTGHTQEIAAAMVAGKGGLFSWGMTAQKAIWKNLLNDEEREFITTTAKTEAETEPTAELATILNRLIQHSDFGKTKPFDDLESLFKEDGPRRAVEELKARVTQGEATPERLNRVLLATALESPAIAKKPRMISVRMWQPPDTDIQALGVEEPFMIIIKAVLVLGLLISSPWVFLQLWNFVASGLYPTERKYVYTYLPFSLGLFFAGAALAFVFVFQPVLDFLFSFNLMLNIDAAPRINEWVSFVLFLPIGFGVSFQLPLVMLLLERLGIFTIENYRTRWRVAILVIFVVSMLLTPSDPTSMMLMGVPLTALYFGGIALCRYMPRKRSPLGPAVDPA